MSNNFNSNNSAILADLCSIGILIVIDGQHTHWASFGPGDPADDYFGLSEVIRTLADRSVPSLPHFVVTKAHRDKDPTNFTSLSMADQKLLKPNFENFKFDEHNLDQFDEIWLFGVGTPEDTALLSEKELVAIARFMDGGGGVFATGDHEDLGFPLCGRIPRVRSMRKWYFPSPGPQGEPVAPPSISEDRIDTTRAGHDDHFIFDDQSDDIPQEIIPKPYGVVSGPLKLSYYPHPLLCGPRGMISVLPDHMHEGEVIEPWATNQTLTFDGEVFVEYPNDVGGNRLIPEIIAWGKVLAHTLPSTEPAHTGDPNNFSVPRTFGVIGAYDGHLANIGRVAVDSTWHHFFDINLIGDPLAPPPKTLGFKATAAGLLALDDIKAYYRNIGMWLARATTQRNLLAGACWFASQTHPLNEMLRPDFVYGSKAILNIGSVARDALGRVAPRCQLIVWTILHLKDERIRRVLDFDPWNPPGGDAQGARTVLDPSPLVEAVLGGSVVVIAQKFRGHDAKNLPHIKEKIHQVVAEGIEIGLGALAEELARYGHQITRFAEHLKSSEAK